MKHTTQTLAACLLTALFVLACSTAGLTATAPAPAQASDGPKHIVARIAPCTYEDGSPRAQDRRCFWDAAARGNGQGDSFIGYKRPRADIRVKYISDAYAARLTRKWAKHTVFIP